MSKEFKEWLDMSISSTKAMVDTSNKENVGSISKTKVQHRLEVLEEVESHYRQLNN